MARAETSSTQTAPSGIVVMLKTAKPKLAATRRKFCSALGVEEWVRASPSQARLTT